MKLKLKTAILLSSILLAGCATNNDSFGRGPTAAGDNTVSAPTYQFPPTRPATGSKIIIVDPNEHAWGAYDPNGTLVAQGPASAGRGFCPDINSACKTPSGTFSVYRKEGADCKSNIFPIPEGGAPMPYCMYFHGGYALHGSYEVPNYNASHGCVRLHPSDAQWLSQNFVTIGTKVTILPY